MPRHINTVMAALAGAAAVAAMVVLLPVASADPDGGVCARLNGVPFYIPPEGYMSPSSLRAHHF